MSTASGYLGKFVWTAGTFVVSAVLKFGLNIVLAYLLAPEILGVMVVVNAIRLGVELLTDVGIEQNIIHHRDGLDRQFRDTAWTLQLLRGVLLSLVFLIAAPFLAHAYGIDVRIFLVAALSPMIGGAHSTAIFVLVKQMEVRRRNLFELSCEALAFAVQVALAAWLRSVWAPVIGLVLAVAIRSALSYLLPDPGQRLRFDRDVVRRIIHFGKWIAITSLVMYAATNLDRLYLGRVAPLALLGIYGIARAIAELPTTLARRMSYQIIFPALASVSEGDRAGQMAAIAGSRAVFTLGVCAALALAASVADGLILVIYDPRYQAASWMLSVLLGGAVFAVLSNLNEALLLSAGRPFYASVANMMRLATLAVLLPTGHRLAGFPGAVVAVAVTELLQYGYIAVGLHRVRMSFWRQDALAIGAACAVFAVMLAVRWQLGFGSPLAGLGRIG
ncbi:O-antigen/teichoic acid export membrane protein [Sphingomonas faeni]|uniref:O-antigen/teichoic acid export membrane protein n=1 Tax=Sphingomonas faeni TaxID=185950 RepID=A0A2T5UAP5_9SPHN|nr:oligosaccharide flippase family protein [Sphingomonas faeni]PTW48569.1 O-antigen/teichoic acid export membrane protein [Sphingomonas faeni]